MKILFLCTGNICRSAMADIFFRERLRLVGAKDVEVRSAGVAAFPGSMVPDEVLKVAARAGLNASAHRARLVSGELLDWADLVLAMDASHKRTVERHYPRAAGKTHLLKVFTGAPGNEDIGDPIGQSQAVYDACAAEIQDALERLMTKVSGGE